MVAPLTVPLVVLKFGWHGAFVFTGMMSMTFVIVWSLVYREPENHKRVSAAELAYIRSDSDATAAVQKLTYTQMLSKRAAWAFLLGKFLTDPVWWFYLFWLPGFLNLKYHVDLVHLGPPLVAIYLAADFGSIGGGWLSSFLLKTRLDPGQGTQDGYAGMRLSGGERDVCATGAWEFVAHGGTGGDCGAVRTRDGPQISIRLPPTVSPGLLLARWSG